MGKSAGVVSSVPYSHAPPATYVAHEPSRKNYHNIANQMINSQLDVVIAPGHPFYDDNHRRVKKPDYTYISPSDWRALSSGQTAYSFFQKTQDFSRMARTNMNFHGKRVWGVPQVGSTLQEKRSSVAKKSTLEQVGQTPFTKDVPTLSDLSLSVLNVLDDNKNGSFLMIEGGAIDWCGHANETARSIEETTDFIKAIDDVSAWVEKYSSWNDTLLIVTADHETGFINGPSKDNFRTLSKDGSAIQMQWLSDEHTNQLVPFFVHGAGSDTVLNLAKHHDLKRGRYLDNTAFAQLVMKHWWVKH